MKISLFLITPLIVGGALLSGCGAGPQPMATDEMKKDENAAVKARAIFDANKGEWSALPEATKKQVADIYGGDQARAATVWGLMAHPPQSGMPMPPGGK
ncbi:MAG: hypothetical protein C4320_00540 [Armatimonadota bacterium]